MANVYVEPRPKGRPEGSAIDDYVVEDHADHVLGTFKTQRESHLPVGSAAPVSRWLDPDRYLATGNEGESEQN
jgi:hypothetical protein